jgi:hypothetical protein
MVELAAPLPHRSTRILCNQQPTQLVRQLLSKNVFQLLESCLFFDVFCDNFTEEDRTTV